MKWVLILAVSASNYTVYEKFETEEMCASKLEVISAALKQVDSNMFVTCRMSKPRDYLAKTNIVVTKTVIR